MPNQDTLILPDHIKSIEDHFGAYLVNYTDGTDQLYQCDWDYPYLAAELGMEVKDWNIQSDQYGELIAKAIEYIDERI